MKSGRPKLSQIQLKNGFYIEVCNKGTTKGVKIWSESKKAMEAAIAQYASSKNVIVLGEYKDGMPLLKKAVA